MNEFASYLRALVGLAPNTITAYVRDVQSFQTFLDAEITQGTDPKLVERWAISQTTKGKDPDPSTVVRRLAALKKFCKFNRWPDLTSDVPRPKGKHSIPRPIPNVIPLIQFMPLDLKLCCIVLLESGMRISEAYSLRFDVGTIVGNKGGIPPEEVLITGKGGKDRIIPLSNLARAALVGLGGRLPYTKGWLQRRCREFGVNPHRFRHTFGTDMGEAGIDLGVIQDLMGHASPQTTRGYTQYSRAKRTDALAKREQMRAAS